jgi:hypothetical protein
MGLKVYLHKIYTVFYYTIHDRAVFSISNATDNGPRRAVSFAILPQVKIANIQHLTQFYRTAKQEGGARNLKAKVQIGD